MSLPRLQDWVFSLKAFGAASLALYLGFLLSVPRPYRVMATVCIRSSPPTGATRSKSAYRVLGTLIGASVAILLVPNLVDAPELLGGALAGWTALCLYVSLFDRTSRPYLFMLGGHAAALIEAPALANINPSFTWVRLTQRGPVRVKIDEAPKDVQRLSGRTATVVVDPKPEAQSGRDAL